VAEGLDDAVEVDAVETGFGATGAGDGSAAATTSLTAFTVSLMETSISFAVNFLDLIFSSTFLENSFYFSLSSLADGTGMSLTFLILCLAFSADSVLNSELDSKASAKASTVRSNF